MCSCAVPLDSTKEARVTMGFNDANERSFALGANRCQRLLIATLEALEHVNENLIRHSKVRFLYFFVLCRTEVAHRKRNDNADDVKC